MQGVVLHLKHVEAAGIYGWDNVCETIAGDWLEDISQHQVAWFSLVSITKNCIVILAFGILLTLCILNVN